MRKLHYWTFLSALALSACGGGGGGGSDPEGVPGGANGDSGGSTGGSGVAVGTSQFEAPAGMTSRIGLGHGDAYTYESVTEVYGNGSNAAPTSSNRVVYTETVNNPKADLSFESIITNSLNVTDGFKTSALFSKTAAYESTENRVSNCTYKNGQFNPGHQPFVGQTWKSTVEFVCIGKHNGSKSTLITEMESKVTAKEIVTTPVGNFTAFKVESNRENRTVEYESTRIFLNYVCWYDEITGQRVACDTARRNGSQSGLIESKTKHYLIGIDVKNHPIKKHSALRFLGFWDVVFADKSTCLVSATEVRNSSNVKLEGNCKDYAGQNGLLTGSVSPNGEVNAMINGELSPVTGNLTSFSGSGSANYGRGHQTWSATYYQLPL
ncbi:MAG: hypothetical protein EON54_03775 [Alcaligenaceae bacterium]|nr:MAG: hypothetical protein EON54_03775 [Alcaligenaceae bacterium]